MGTGRRGLTGTFPSFSSPGRSMSLVHFILPGCWKKWPLLFQNKKYTEGKRDYARTMIWIHVQDDPHLWDGRPKREAEVNLWRKMATSLPRPLVQVPRFNDGTGYASYKRPGATIPGPFPITFLLSFNSVELNVNGQVPFVSYESMRCACALMCVHACVHSCACESVCPHRWQGVGWNLKLRGRPW